MPEAEPQQPQKTLSWLLSISVSLTPSNHPETQELLPRDQPRPNPPRFKLSLAIANLPLTAIAAPRIQLFCPEQEHSTNVKLRHREAETILRLWQSVCLSVWQQRELVTHCCPQASLSLTQAKMGREDSLGHPG